MEVRAKHPDIQATVYYMDLQMEDEVASRQIALAMEDPGIEYIRSRPAAVQPLPDGGLEVLFEDTLSGEISARRFDLVVLSTGLVPSEGTRRAGELFGLELGPHGFIESGGDLPGRTSVEGVFAAGGATGPVDLVEASASGIAVAGTVLSDLPPTWKVAPRLLLFGTKDNLLDAPRTAERMGAKVNTFEGVPAERLQRLEGEPLDFSAHLDGGGELMGADAVVVAPGASEGDSEVVLPGAMTFEEAWGAVEAGTMRGRLVVVMGRDKEALLLAGALKGAPNTTVDVLYREMAVADGGMQELQFELSSSGVRFHRFEADSLKVSEAPSGGRVVSFRDELLPERGELLLEANMVVAPSATSEEAEPEWAIATHAPDGVPSARRLNVLPVATPRRGVYTGTPGTLTSSATRLGGAAAVAMALSDYARGFPMCEEVAHVDPDDCAACLNCLRVCPHDAIVFDEEERAARILTRACQSCGLCTSTCPALAIDMVPSEGGGSAG
jgi:heterodisulfide reductase subunit A-like polyferredoxin